MDTCKCPRCRKVTCRHYLKLKNRARQRSPKEIPSSSSPASSETTSTENIPQKKSSISQPDAKPAVQFKDPDIIDAPEMKDMLMAAAPKKPDDDGEYEASIYDEPPKQDKNKVSDESEIPDKNEVPIEGEIPYKSGMPDESGISYKSGMSDESGIPDKSGIADKTKDYQSPLTAVDVLQSKPGVAAESPSSRKKLPPFPGAISLTPSDSVSSFGIRLPYDSDYDLTVNVCLHQKTPECSEQCCEDFAKGSQPPPTITMKFETVKSSSSKNVQFTSDKNQDTKNTVSDPSFNKKDSSYCCTKSISDHSSYYSTNMSLHSVSLSCRCSVNRFEVKPAPEIEAQIYAHLSAGCDSCKNTKPIKQLSNAADDTSDVTSLYRCDCRIKSSEFSCISSTTNNSRPGLHKKSKIPVKRNGKNCCSCTNTSFKSDFSKNSLHERSTDTASICTPPQIVSGSKEEVSIIKQVNIDLGEKIKEMEEGKKKVHQKESYVKSEGSENSSSSSVLDPDKQIILPGIRVEIGPEKIKSIQIDVTPIKLERSSSEIITIPVQLRFKRPPTPPETITNFSLKYDNKVIRAFYKKQKLLYENCIDCAEHIDPNTGEAVISLEEGNNSDMNIIQPVTCSQECRFIKEVTTARTLEKKCKSLSKKAQINIPWCHKSTYIEPYLKIQKCPTQENVETQTDLSLGSKLLSLSLNSSCTSKNTSESTKSDKISKKVSSLQIPWANYTIPTTGTVMFPSTFTSEVRREIFPQPEEIELQPEPKTCSIFPICGKPSSTTSARSKSLESYKVIAHPQTPTSLSKPSSSQQVTPSDKNIEPDLPLGLKPTTPQLRAKRAKSHSELEPKEVKIEKEDSYESFIAPEPRPRPYRPPRTFKNKFLGRGVNRTNQSAYRTVSERNRIEFDTHGLERSGGHEIKRSRIPRLSRKRYERKSKKNKGSDESAISVESKRSNFRKKNKSSNESVASSKISSPRAKSKEREYDESNNTQQQTSKYISVIGRRESVDSCFSDSLFKYHNETPSNYSMRGEPGRSKPASIKDKKQKEEIKKSEKRSKSAETTTKSKKIISKPRSRSAPQKICCPELVDCCTESRETISKRYKFVYLDKCSFHEPYLNKLHFENISVPDGTIPWGKLLLPRNIEIRKLSDMKIEDVKPEISDKMIHINSNPPSQQVSCPVSLNKSQESENSLKYCNSAPLWICKCDSKQISSSTPENTTTNKTKLILNNTSKSKINFIDKSSYYATGDKGIMTDLNVKLDQSNKSTIPCSKLHSQESETVTFYMNKNMTDLTESNKNLCNCGANCPQYRTCKLPDAYRKKLEEPATIPCSATTYKKPSAFILKPDPVIAAFKKCEAEFKPMREALAQVKTNIRNLNMPELDSMFKNDEQEFVVPCCKCIKCTGKYKNVYKAKTQHFYANTTTCAALLEQSRRYWHYEESSQSTTSSEKYCVVPNKRNKGIQKTGSKHCRKRRKHKKLDLQNTSSSESNNSSTVKHCACTKFTHSKYSSQTDSSGQSTTSQEDNKTPAVCTHKKNRKKKIQSQQIMARMSNSDCPFMEAIKSAILQSLGQDVSCTQIIKSKNVKKMKMHLKVKPKSKKR